MIYLKLDDIPVYDYLTAVKGELEHFPIDQVGDIIARHVKERILEIPLYKTGALYESIDWEYAGPTEVIIDAGVSYADYLDQGTRYITAYHFLEYTDEMDAEIEDFIEHFWGEE